jgi:hypothetical protein
VLPRVRHRDRREHEVVSDEDRRDLYAALEQQVGANPAGTLMELLPPVGWADVARQSDLVAVRGEMAHIRGEISQLRAEIKTQLPRLYVANVGLAFATAGLVLAAAKLT